MTVLNKKESYDVTIVGNGIASKVFLFFFLKSYPDKSVCVIESPLYPACSIKTTSHVAVARQVEGAGELGRLVVDSWLAFEAFVKQQRPEGVDEGYLFQDVFENPAPHYFISPSLFLNWLDQQNNSSNVQYLQSHLEVINDQKDGVSVALHDRTFSTQKLLLACGAGLPYLKMHHGDESFKKGFVDRPGSYWRCDAGDYLCEKSWVFTLGKANLIYRKAEHLFLLGGTTNSASELGIDFKTLVEWLKDYKKTLTFLPEFEAGQVDNGTRLRGPKRLPISGKIQGSHNVFALSGLHKNGFSYPFFLANKCLREMFGEN